MQGVARELRARGGQHVLVPVIDVTRDPGCEEGKKHLEKINTNS